MVGTRNGATVDMERAHPVNQNKNAKLCVSSYFWTAQRYSVHLQNGQSYSICHSMAVSSFSPPTSVHVAAQKSEINHLKMISFPIKLLSFQRHAKPSQANLENRNNNTLGARSALSFTMYPFGLSGLSGGASFRRSDIP